MDGSEKSEIERKFDVVESDDLPDFTTIPGVDGVRREGDRRLDAGYFDTPNLALAARRITLRRRTGGNDAGWHLKLPVATDERREITEPLTDDPDNIPVRLRSLVLVHTRDRELIPVVQLKTRRTVIPLLAADGTVLAEFSDDRVKATFLQEPVENAAWREWEIELVDGPGELLAAAAHDFAQHGHQPAELPLKMARALGPRYPADSPAPPRPTRKEPASAVLLAYLHEQIEALKAHDPGVREGTPDAVHQLRVAARRLRSVLASYRKLTERNTAKLLRSELQWLAGTVGGGQRP